MLERIIADVLVRVLGSYVDGLNKESIRVGIWQGDMELRHLRLRPEALAVLFETLGLDLPVTVTAGYIGLLRLEVPWNSLRSAPVRIFMHDVTVVASPVSDGDQTALEERDQRLKAARLTTDEALRDAKFSVRSIKSVGTASGAAPDDIMSDAADAPTGNAVTRWGWRFTSRFVTKIVDNIQIDVENVVVQYEDKSSVRECPYTATLAFDSLRACSTDRNWAPVFIESPTSPVVHKVVYMRGLVLNWEPGNANNDIKSWILNPDVERTPGKWSGFVRTASRLAIRPLDGELRIALTKSSALTAALSGKDPALADLKNMPRVQLDLHFPDVKIVLDDFQYHTLLSTIMYLSDIDRKVRPKTARGRWFWALERLLPRFKERRLAALRFNAEGLRKRRVTREAYCKARNAVVNARGKGIAESTADADIVTQLEKELPYEEVVMFRDIADEQLSEGLSSGNPATAASSRFWSLFSRAGPAAPNSPSENGSGESTPTGSRSPSIKASPIRTPSENHLVATDSQLKSNASISANQLIEDLFDENVEDNEDACVPNFRMGFLLGRGAIELKKGGHFGPPVAVSSLEFKELRLGIETRPGTGLLLEALLGTFEVVDLQQNIKIMYPRAPWAGEHDGERDSSFASALGGFAEDHGKIMSQSVEQWVEERRGSRDASLASSSKASLSTCAHSAVLHSYPHDISNAIAEIRGEYGTRRSSMSQMNPSFNYCSLEASIGGGSSSASLSGISSDGALSGVSMQNREDLSIAPQTPLKYIAALRLNHEEAPEGEWACGATRMAMDLAIGGMEVLVDGPRSAFISSVNFWHPREKMPSIMHFLTRSAAPRLASLRMDLQRAILERSVPMRMDLLIRGPRFIIPGSPGSDISLVLDLGTFAMETSTGPPKSVHLEEYKTSSSEATSRQSPEQVITIRYTDYKMAATDLGLYVVAEAGKQAAERIIRPFSVHLLLQVLHNASFLEAITLPYRRVDIAKVKLIAQLPSLRTSVSHDAFRHILDVIKGWGEGSKQPVPMSGIEPNRAVHSVTFSAELEGVRYSHQMEDVKLRESILHISPLVAFEMSLDFEELQLELRDSQSRRIVTITTSGIGAKLKRRQDVLDFDFLLRTFCVLDGSRGATAPFRRLAFAGVEKRNSLSHRIGTGIDDAFSPTDQRSFISLSYRADMVNHEQSLGVRILSLHVVCVRETYFALADFFYLSEPKQQKQPGSSRSPSSSIRSNQGREEHAAESLLEHKDGDIENAAEYSDPFAALGMTTSGAARVLREHAGRGMVLSKQALANRGKLSLTADLDGMDITLVTAEGAIACFDVTDCVVNLSHLSNGAVMASGELGGFSIRDLTSAFDVYSETMRYNRSVGTGGQGSNLDPDGWTLRIPEAGRGDIWLEAKLRNLKLVYLQRFAVILKKYFDVLRDSLKPVLEMKGGIAEVFSVEQEEDLRAILVGDGRIRLNVITEDVDVVMPRHSQSPYEALRFSVTKSSITNEDRAATGYQIGFQLKAEGVNAHVLYQPPAEGEGRALIPGGKEPVLRQISPTTPVDELCPFSENICIVAKVDAWRRRRVPEVVLNADGIPVLKDGQEEKEYDPSKWLPSIRVRISFPDGISARLCEAEYSILYFTFTENVIERPDIEFTDIVRGLKTPVLPARKPVQPIMFSSNRMPPNYQILFEVPCIDSVIMSGADPRDGDANIIRAELRHVVGCFEYGVDYRMTIEVTSNMNSLQDARPQSKTKGMTLIMPTKEYSDDVSPHGDQTRNVDSSTDSNEMPRSVALTWDRPFGFRTNVMVVLSDLRIIVEPELFRDVGLLTAPGYPFLKSSAPPPLIRFNGRLLILTISRPEIWLMAKQYPGDGRSLVVRGNVIAKVKWAAVTGRNTVEVAANRIRVNLSTRGPFCRPPISPQISLSDGSQSTTDMDRITETPMLYPCDISLKFEGRGYDPPKNPGDEPRKAPGSNLYMNAESFLIRIDVNDTPLILAVASNLARLKSSMLSRRPVQPGRFDEWIDKGEDGDAKLSIYFSLPQSRLMFTDETAGRYVPIMEARIRNAVLRSNVPWLTNATFGFALDLFNEEKGWWEPGIETFPVEIALSKGQSGSQAIHVRADKIIDINVTPNTVSGAARVSKALKSAIEDLIVRLIREDMSDIEAHDVDNTPMLAISSTALAEARRPSVAAFCVRNETGRPVMMWLPYDSKRKSLHGNGGEIEVDTPSGDLLWTAMNSAGGPVADPNSSRRLSMTCILSLSGYEAVKLSAEQTGSRLVSFLPEFKEVNPLLVGNRGSLSPLTLVWDVTMREGVPCGCIRSILRVINHTQILLEVNVEGLSKSKSSNPTTEMTDDIRAGHADVEREAHGLVRTGESWSIPIHAVDRAIRVRPALLRAPISEDDIIEDGLDAQPSKGRVYYSYKWSDPLSKVSALQQTGERLHSRKVKPGPASNGDAGVSGVRAPILTCMGADRRQVFCLSIQPKVGNGSGSGKGWVDVLICAPVVLENLMPKPVSFKLASLNPSRSRSSGQIFAEGYIEPSREIHIHGIGSDLGNVAIALGMDNAPDPSTATGRRTIQGSRAVGEYHVKLPTVQKVAVRTGKASTFSMNLDHEQTVTTRKVRMYCEYWIRNRSDTDLFFIDRQSTRDPYTINPKVFLRRSPPGSKAESFICFSGRWLSFKTIDRNEDVWVNIATEVSEIDKPLHIGFDGLSLLLDVRPAKGRFQRALVVTIFNSVWLENRTESILQWCQPAALNKKGIALSSKVHQVNPGACIALHWDYRTHRKALCLRRAENNGSSDWIWSRSVGVDGLEGEFAAKMYRPKRHEQYIARVVVSKLGNGVSSVVVHPEDRNTPPYRIVNKCETRSIAFRQTGVNETHPWLVRPGRTIRYSWDDPQAPVKSRSLIVEVIDGLMDGADPLANRSKLTASGPNDEQSHSEVAEPKKEAQKREMRYPKFELNIDMIREDVPFSQSSKFEPELIVSVHVKGPTKVVTFVDKIRDDAPNSSNSIQSAIGASQNTMTHVKDDSATSPLRQRGILDVEVYVNALGISFVESVPVELAYLSVTGIHFRLDRFDNQQMMVCEVQDVQLDNQLVHCTWPVVLWSPPAIEAHAYSRRASGSNNTRQRSNQKPFFQLTINGPYPSMTQGIGTFRGIFVALQQLKIAADEDFVLRVWLFAISLIEAAGGSNEDKEEVLQGNDGLEKGLPTVEPTSLRSSSKNSTTGAGNTLLSRLYVEHLELCPLKLTISFTSSRTSTAAEHIGGFRSLIRTLVAVLGNVENAEFRFNALQLQHVFDTTSHFRSLIGEYYISQGSNQKMVLLASNSLIGNPSQLFDSIAIGTRDFFVEPANAKNSADFIASIGRGSSSLLTNTVGGLVGSLGGIPRAVAQGLETAVGDREYLAERDSIRGGRARIVSSPAQGLVTGALSFGHGIASGAAGLLRDPIHGAAEEGASGFIKGLGKGFLGGVLKPITGALDLIAEPAAGFRSMMVSDRYRGSAEPARPPRAFWGVRCDRMTSYDLRASLGQAILAIINHREGDSDERLRSWTHLEPVQSSASSQDFISFLWELLRRSTRSSNFPTKYLKDPQGNPQRAEKMRAGLITNRRLIVSSLDGHVLWDYPLAGIADTQVSLESKHLLMVGVRSGRYNSSNLAPSWTKIHCGSMNSRDELNAALRKTLEDMRAMSSPSSEKASKEWKSPGQKSIALKEIRRSATRGGSVEMVDMSSITESAREEENMTEMKILHQDASVDGRRGIFTDMKLPGREPERVTDSSSESITELSVKRRIRELMNLPSMRHVAAVRSIRILLVNATGQPLKLDHSTLESGQWAQRPPEELEANEIGIIEADGTENRVLDVSGLFSMYISPTDATTSEMFVIRFLNPLLAANAFVIQAPDGYTWTRRGGEKGDHVLSVITLHSTGMGKNVLENTWKRGNRAVEPLLFGRSTVSPYLPPINYRPPHLPLPTKIDPNDPELISNLCSLGFKQADAQAALQQNEGDLSKAYASLIEKKTAL